MSSTGAAMSRDDSNRTYRPPPRGKARQSDPSRGGVLYQPDFVSPADRDGILGWLAGLHPLWEDRYPAGRPLRHGQTQRRLLRPVYWLGSWQFACLDYYRPPKGMLDRCVRAEPFPPVLARLVAQIEQRAHTLYRGPVDLPPRWQLNTCLVNFYGSRVEPDGTKVDTARVGEHRDHEPGPVASISLGERALFQFVAPVPVGAPEHIILQQWLDDGSLQVFGSDRWKKNALHRVQRVDRRAGHRFELQVPGFETRRVNFTFRYVPDEHVTTFSALAPAARQDVTRYVTELAATSPFWARALAP